jgi:hypothetical protein
LATALPSSSVAVTCALSSLKGTRILARASSAAQGKELPSFAAEVAAA